MLRVFAESNKVERLRSMCPTGFRDSGNSVVNGFQPACFLPAITINEFLTLPIASRDSGYAMTLQVNLAAHGRRISYDMI